ncbi:hypothetical protein LCGC14_0223180 [marine sediment metagenome]|uniref:Uncharacterized protein n=1 Tax=marine sediment metagenome TaxID=412755 RepID=A0A0F9UC24_9ZZZZ|nr:hypothetical protein [bacterium]
MRNNEQSLKYAETLREFYSEMSKKDIPFDQLLDFYANELLSDMPKNIREGCIKLSDFSEKDWKCLIAANVGSDKLVSYGIKGSIVKERGTKMSWSNGSRTWFTHQPVDKRDSIRLDANEMIIPCSFKRAERLRCYINELPLYYSSTEAKMRGEISAKDSLDIYTEGRVGSILDSLPKDQADKLKDQIRKKGWGFFFGS